MTDSHLSPLNKVFTIGAVGALSTALIAWVLFSGFLPGPNGWGHDYALYFPNILAEYYASLVQGAWTPAWFTPAFCGGMPLWADPGAGSFSVFAILVRILGANPINALHVTFLGMVILGFLGAYLFAALRLNVSPLASAVAGVLFALNGFFIYRFLIGHLGFHGIALVPLLAFFITSAQSLRGVQWHREALAITGGGLIVAYWIHNGAASILVALFLATAALILLHWIRGANEPPALIKGSAIVILGLALSANKLSASLAFLSHAPRSGYLLPGFEDPLITLKLVFSMLFLNERDIAIDAARHLQNAQWALDRQELEYGVSVVPVLLLLILGAIRFLAPPVQKPRTAEFSLEDLSPPQYRISKAVVYGTLLGLLLSLPIALNTYSPSWNEFLKGLPILGSTSSYVRWILIYIPITAIVSALLLDKIAQTDRAKKLLSGIAIIIFLLQLGSTDRAFYENQSYQADKIIDAYHANKIDPNPTPHIHSIDAYVNDAGEVVLVGNRNDLIADGVSQLACYAPIFGYRLEFFPFKTLTFGDPLSEQNGRLNFKNPACYVFPNENKCEPGDHFKLSDAESLKDFLAYGAFNFKKSSTHLIMEMLTQFAWMALLILLFYITVKYLLLKLSRKDTSRGVS